MSGASVCLGTKASQYRLTSHFISAQTNGFAEVQIVTRYTMRFRFVGRIVVHSEVWMFQGHPYTDALVRIEGQQSVQYVALNDRLNAAADALMKRAELEALLWNALDLDR